MTTPAEQTAMAMFQAVQSLTEQNKAFMEKIAELTQAAQLNKGQTGKAWDHPDRYRNVKQFSGDSKEWEEFRVKFRSQIAAGKPKVDSLMRAIEEEMKEEELEEEDHTKLDTDFEDDFVEEINFGLYNLLLNMTTGEANATVRRCVNKGMLAWKRLSDTLNPRTLASGIKAISAVLSPPKVSSASKVDACVEQWEDKMAKLDAEYSQTLTSKMKVAVLYSMLPRDMQDRLLDRCAVSWDRSTETEAAKMFTSLKLEIKNIAKARRELSGPKPMEVDQVMKWADHEDWDNYGYEQWFPEDSENQQEEKHDHDDEHHVNYVGKGYKGFKGNGKGKGFAGNCYGCGEFGHSQRNCPNGKAKGKGHKGDFKGFGKGDYQYQGKSNFKGFGDYKGYGKGGKGEWRPTPRACFQCGALDHIIKDCPHATKNIQQVREDSTEPEVMFIGHVNGKTTLVSKHESYCRPCGEVSSKQAPKFVNRVPVNSRIPVRNSFQVLQEDEPDEDDEEPEVMHIRTVENPAPGTKFRIGNGIIKDKKSGKEEQDWVDLGMGEIVVDSAADESCWPKGSGDAYKTMPSRKKIVLKTANGSEMQHYGEKKVLFRHGGGPDVVGLTFQVTDVGRPLLAVRRLVEKGCTVHFGESPEDNYILDPTKVRIPMTKKGGSFVIRSSFVMPGFPRPA